MSIDLLISPSRPQIKAKAMKARTYSSIDLLAFS